MAASRYIASESVCVPVSFLSSLRDLLSAAYNFFRLGRQAGKAEEGGVSGETGEEEEKENVMGLD